VSLDVYLRMPGLVTAKESGGIFIRENGETREISREEWDERFPGREPLRMLEVTDDSGEVFEANITHNLGRMADAAGVYDCCWRPEEHGFTHARQLIEPLRQAVAAMRADPEKFRAHDSPNGWGKYEHFLPWLERYLAACEEYPDAEVRVSR
jgi:hypothetical protein